MPSPMQDQGVWPSCSQGKTRWMGLTNKTKTQNELGNGSKMDRDKLDVQGWSGI